MDDPSKEEAAARGEAGGQEYLNIGNAANDIPSGAKGKSPNGKDDDLTIIDWDQARTYLKVVSEDAESEIFTWQLFDDDKDRREPADSRNGRLDDFTSIFARKNREGHGICVTINKTDGRGRKAENIKVRRAVWFEWDRADRPLPQWPISPHIVVSTSPGKYQGIWASEPLGQDVFEGALARLTELGSDPNATKTTQVLRIPGFFHQKKDEAKGLTGQPHRVRIVERNDIPRYTEAEIKAAFPAPASTIYKNGSTNPFLQGEPQNLEADVGLVAAALDVIPNDNPDWDWWNRVAMAVFGATGGSDVGFNLFDRWSQKWPGYNAKDTADKWEALHGSPPDRIGAGTLFRMANEAWPGWRNKHEGVSLGDFHAYMPRHNY